MLSRLESGSDIGAECDRLLREADAYHRFPTPVADIVAAAKLTEPEQSLLSESMISRAPKFLQEKIRAMSGKLEGLLDRRTREVHLHPDIDHDAHRNFVRLHEVTHDILPWQSELGYVDDNRTLAWSVKQLYEQEANQGAAELGFQMGVFASVAGDYEIGLAAVGELVEKFGFSWHATLRRYAESHREAVAAVVLEHRPSTTAPLAWRRKEALASASWVRQFGPVEQWPKILTASTFDFIAIAAARPPLARIGQGSASFVDLRGETHLVQVEVFDNTYHQLVLLWIPSRRPRLITRRRVAVVD